jgi:glyoxylate/hydroxypyruvate/2-ketogluconate reductase
MKPKIIIARTVFPEVVTRLQQHFDVTDNQADVAWSKAEWTERLSQHVGAFSMGIDPVDASVLQACPQLKICANMSVGYNNLDVPAMTRHGVLATNAPDVLTETTADFGFALMMAAARRVTESEHFLRAGQWKQWRYDLFAGAEVHGSTLGIMGMGRIGQAIARRGAHGFGMQVIYHNRSRLAPDTEAACGARYVGKDELLQSADHLVLVVPYSKEAHHTIGAAELARMKPTATLTNIARGGIVDDAALIIALREGRIAAAGLDVFEGEPALNPGFLGLKNVVLTPHIASSTVATRLAMAHLAADNLIGYLTEGKARTPLNPEVIGAAQ